MASTYSGQSANQQSGSSSIPPHIAHNLGDIQKLLISTFQIPLSLLDRSKHDIHQAFAKYEAIQDITRQYNKMIANGTWKHDVIQLLILIYCILTVF